MAKKKSVAEKAKTIYKNTASEQAKAYNRRSYQDAQTTSKPSASRTSTKSTAAEGAKKIFEEVWNDRQNRSTMSSQDIKRAELANNQRNRQRQAERQQALQDYAQNRPRLSADSGKVQAMNRQPAVARGQYNQYRRELGNTDSWRANNDSQIARDINKQRGTYAQAIDAYDRDIQDRIDTINAYEQRKQQDAANGKKRVYQAQEDARKELAELQRGKRALQESNRWQGNDQTIEQKIQQIDVNKGLIRQSQAIVDAYENAPQGTFHTEEESLRYAKARDDIRKWEQQNNLLERETVLGRLSEGWQKELVRYAGLREEYAQGSASELSGAQQAQRGIDIDKRRQAIQKATGLSDEEMDLAIDAATRQYNANKADLMRQQASDMNTAELAVSNALTVFNNFAKAKDLPAVVQAVINDVPVDTNAMGATLYNDIIRGESSDRILKSKVAPGLANFLYQTTMSMADFLVMMPLNTPDSDALSLALMGTGAGMEAVKEGTERGLDARHALVTGVLAGAFEAMFEKVSIETLLNPKAGDGALRYILKNTLAEGSEEVCTDIANNISDILVNGGLSEYRQNILAYVRQGYTQEEASTMAAQDFAKNLALSFAGGALSGAVMSSFASLSPNFRAESLQDQIDALDVQTRELINDAFNPAQGRLVASADTMNQIMSNIQQMQEMQQEQVEIYEKQNPISTQPNNSNALDALGSDNLESSFEGAAVEAEAEAVVPEERTQFRTIEEAEETLEAISDRIAETDTNDPALEKLSARYQEVSDIIDDWSGYEQTRNDTRNAGERNVQMDTQESGGRSNGESTEAGEQGFGSNEIRESAQRTTDELQEAGITRGKTADFLGAIGTDTDGQSAEIPENVWKSLSDADTYQAIYDNAKSKGVDVHFVSGLMQVHEGGRTIMVDGIQMANGQRYITIDSETKTAAQIDGHEDLHWVLDTTTNSVAERRAAIDKMIETVSANEGFAQFYQDLAEQNYIFNGRDSFYDADGNLDEDLFYYEAEELLANAHGDIDIAAKDRESKASRYTDTVKKAATEQRANARRGPPAEAQKIAKKVESGKMVTNTEEVEFSRVYNDKLMEAADKKNEELGFVDKDVMDKADKQRQQVKEWLEQPEVIDNLPDDITGKTILNNGSYGKTYEPTTICTRTLATEGLLDAVSKKLGHPLSVQESIWVAQTAWEYLGNTGKCTYCYVAMDRKAKREFRGKYIKQREQVVQWLKDGAKVSEAQQRYAKEILGRSKGNKTTNARVSRWARILREGGEFVTNKIVSDIKFDESNEQILERYPAVAEELLDLLSYSQSASYAKKYIGFTAYNGEILKMDPELVKQLNEYFGLRMYSFSDYHPAFLLENMQVVTDAAVRGLKVLAYTKDIDFARTFEPTNANINISIFAQQAPDADGNFMEDAMQGAEWEQAKAVRAESIKNGTGVGIVMVATNDQQVEWAMAQDWIDVVIPFHMVKTGAEVADAFGWTNYTHMQEDRKTKAWTKNENVKSIVPPMHQNDYATYQKALKDNNLTARFDKWSDIEKFPGSMKLVNETRRADGDTPAVQPVFNLDGAKESIDSIAKGRDYYRPIGGTQDNLDVIAEETADEIRGGKRGPRYSRSVDSTGRQLSEQQAEYFKDSKIRDKDGNLQVVYHGTPRGDFTVFDEAKIGTSTDYGWYGRGFYFTDKPQSAKYYAGYLNSSRVMEGYLNITNPYVLRKAKTDSIKDVMSDIMGARYDTAQETAEAFTDWLKKEGYDGLITDGQYMIFNSNQFKNADNVQPTSNPDIRYSRSVDSEGTSLSQEQEAYFKDSKIRDEDGNLQVVYHGTDAEFSVFDRTKSRSTMDIQGSFFSPWDIDAAGYGPNVRAYYLNITNPAPEGVAYKALNRFKGQNDAGIKAREYLESLGYDGVNNGNEEYIAFNPEQIKLASNPTPTSDPDIRFSRVTDQDTIDFLENQDHVKVYRAMQVIDGQLYPPMAARVKDESGKKQLVMSSEFGQWEQADERPELIRKGNKFELDKANGSSIDAAYNPYFHTSGTPLNDQFSSAYKRDNLVVVEGEIPSSELTSGYKAQYAKDSVGKTKWHAGPVASKLKGDKARTVYLSRWFKPLRIVPDSEVASIVAKTLEGENIKVPENVVTPGLRAELEKAGVPIEYRNADTRFSRVGTDEETGRPIYRSNFPTGTPKAAKAQRILNYIQNVWSKKPIPLVIHPGKANERTIHAKFDPTYSSTPGEWTDASKLMGGNRHGTAKEQRVTLDLADDYYEIAAGSRYNYSKPEEGKNKATHEGVREWHCFVNDIMFQEYGSDEMEPYTVSINVKQKADGEYVYSFSAEKEGISTQQTLHAADIATRGGENAKPSSAISIPSEEANGNTSGMKSSRAIEDDDTTVLRQAIKDLTKTVDTIRKQKEYWKNQTKTSTPSVTQASANRMATAWIERTGSTMKKAEVAAKIKELGDWLRSGSDDISILEARKRARAVAKDLIDTAEILVNDVEMEAFDDIKKSLKQNMMISPADASDIPDFEDWRKHHFGQINIRKGTGGFMVDQAYQELAQAHPEYFPEDITHPADQLLRMADVYDSMEPVFANPYDSDYDAALAAYETAMLEDAITMETTAPTFADQKEAEIEQIKQIAADRLQRVRQQRDQQIQALKDHYKEVAEKKRARRADSEARTRLLKIAKRLRNKKLPAVTRAKIDEYIGDLDLVAKSMTGATEMKLSSLKEWYEDQKKNNPDFIANATIEAKLDRLNKRQINDLTQEEIADLTDILLNIENEIRTQDKFIKSEIAANTYAAGQQVIVDIEATRGPSKADKLVTGMLTPEREARRITGYRDSDPLYVAVRELSKGANAMYAYQNDAERQVSEWTHDEKFMKDFAGPKAKEISLAIIGRPDIVITPAMRASLYLHSLNADNMKHIANGGATIPDMKLYKRGKTQEAYDKGITIKLTPSQVKAITSEMSGQEKAYAQATSQYFNTTSRDAINAVSEAKDGFSIAGVENYFPIDTNKAFLKSDFETIKRDGTIEGMGFTKERVNASNPLMLYDMDTVLNRSISQHAKYVGLAIPVRNFNKLWNVGTWIDETEPSGVQNSLIKVWGRDSYDYVAKMMADLQNPKSQSDDIGKLLGNVRSRYAGAVLELNLSVAIKQSASYPTAAAVLGYGPLIKAMGNFGKVDLDIVRKYSPMQAYREKGFSTQELGEITSRKGKTPALLNWIQGMDVETTRKLWKASEYYVRDNFPGLEPGTEAFYKKVGEIHTKVLEETQPNYTVMQRPQFLRSDSDLTKTLMMFKTQPFQNFNILYDATENLKTKYRAFKNGGSEDDYKTARKTFARAVSSQLLASFVFALMQYAWDGFRKKDDKYRNDDDDVTFGSWLKGMSINMLGNGFGMLPFGSEIFELIEVRIDKILKRFGADAFFDAKSYGLSDSIVDQVNNTVKAVSKVSDELLKIGSEDWDGAVALDTIKDSATTLAQFAGVPAKNVLNLFNAAKENIDAVIQGQDPNSFMSKRDKANKDVTKAPGWSELDEKQKDKIRKEITSWAQDTGSDAAAAYVVKNQPVPEGLRDTEAGKIIDGEGNPGVSADDYFSYRVALFLADRPNGSGTTGTFDRNERMYALEKAALTDKERRYIWSHYYKGDYDEYLKSEAYKEWLKGQ